MPTKIRLQRHGKKAYAFFHIVVSDGRTPRDGKFIEKIGTYNPNTNPATIEIDMDSAFNWIKTGAQPTDTCRAILSYKGVMMRHHLYRGVEKGALTQEQADAKLAKWMEEKAAKVESKKTGLTDSALSADKKRAQAETAANEARIAKIAAKNAVVVEEPKAEVVETPAAENTDNA
ncbi:MAG: 30S ribosomal protein S16 [Bacteroidetes bacterium]|jgi:small subunit ribosomal protein S16|nr:30S ribosomal protein S16 [Bacteroidota bacterium]